jgi:predicted small lipoprotein YifL
MLHSLNGAHINSNSCRHRVNLSAIRNRPGLALFHGFGVVSGIPFRVSAFCCNDGTETMKTQPGLLIAFIISLAFVAACGQQGPLFLPGSPSEIQSAVQEQQAAAEASEQEDDEDDEDDEDNEQTNNIN